MGKAVGLCVRSSWVECSWYVRLLCSLVVQLQLLPSYVAVRYPWFIRPLLTAKKLTLSQNIPLPLPTTLTSNTPITPPPLLTLTIIKMDSEVRSRRQSKRVAHAQSRAVHGKKGKAKRKSAALVRSIWPLLLISSCSLQCRFLFYLKSPGKCLTWVLKVPL